MSPCPDDGEYEMVELPDHIYYSDLVNNPDLNHQQNTFFEATQYEAEI